MGLRVKATRSQAIFSSQFVNGYVDSCLVVGEGHALGDRFGSPSTPLTGSMICGLGHVIQTSSSIVGGFQNQIYPGESGSNTANNIIGGQLNTIAPQTSPQSYGGHDNLIVGNNNTCGSQGQGIFFSVIGGEFNIVTGLSNLTVGTLNSVAGLCNIVGGTSNTTIGNGASNNIVCGDTNIFVGNNSLVVGNLNIGGLNSIVAGINNASGTNSLVVGANNIGSTNSLVVGSDNYSSNTNAIVGGKFASNIKPNDLAMGTGGGTVSTTRGSVGLYGKTTNATPQQLGSSYSSFPTTPTEFFDQIFLNNIYRFRIFVTAVMDTIGDMAAFEGSGAIRNILLTTTLVNPVTMLQVQADASMVGTSVAITATNTNNGTLDVTVTGIIATNIFWVVRIDYERINF